MSETTIIPDLYLEGDSKHPISHEIQELGQNFLDLGRALEHGIGNAGKIHDLLVQRTLRIHEGLESVHFLSVFQDHGTDLNDSVSSRGQACGFQVKGHKFLIKGHIAAAMDNDSVIHIVDVVAFTAVEDFDQFIRTRDLGLLPFHAMQRIGEGLAAAMVGDGNGPMTPGSCLLNSGEGGCQRIHVGHGGMQVQFHTDRKSVV